MTSVSGQILTQLAGSLQGPYAGFNPATAIEKEKMANPTLSSALSHHESEILLRMRLKEAYDHYQAAAGKYRKLLNERSRASAPDADCDLAIACHAESQALAEYTRTLKSFTELIVCGKHPEEQTSSDSEGL